MAGVTPCGVWRMMHKTTKHLVIKTKHGFYHDSGIYGIEWTFGDEAGAVRMNRDEADYTARAARQVGIDGVEIVEYRKSCIV